MAAAEATAAAPPSRIYLTGFMAAGKTAVGAALAALLGLRFLDLDREVERRAGTSIRRIFERQGEAAFRDLEHTALRATASLDSVVVATGGGTMAFERNRSLIRELGICVWLDASFETVVARLDAAGQSRRPLFRSRDEARALYDERLPAYRMADFRVAVSQADTATGVAARIARLLPRESVCAT